MTQTLTTKKRKDIMKTMHKMSLLILCTFFLFSCDEKPIIPTDQEKLIENCADESENRLIGKWQLIGEGYYDDNDALIMNPLENDGRYVEFREDLNMIRPYGGEPIVYPYRTEGDILFENYLDETNMFVYQFCIKNNILILKYMQGNIPETARQIVVFKYKKV